MIKNPIPQSLPGINFTNYFSNKIQDGKIKLNKKGIYGIYLLKKLGKLIMSLFWMNTIPIKKWTSKNEWKKENI